MSKLWPLKCSLKFYFSKKQRAALSGKAIMSNELFWECLNAAYCHHDMETYKKIWHSYPQYVQEFNEKFDREFADPTSELRKEHDTWWGDLKPKLIEEFGEAWVEEHCLV